MTVAELMGHASLDDADLTLPTADDAQRAMDLLAMDGYEHLVYHRGTYHRGMD